MAWFVPGCDGLVGDRGRGWASDVEVVGAGAGFLQEFSRTVAKEFVNTDLDFECRVSVVTVELVVLVADERDRFLGCFG